MGQNLSQSDPEGAMEGYLLDEIVCQAVELLPLGHCGGGCVLDPLPKFLDDHLGNAALQHFSSEEQ